MKNKAFTLLELLMVIIIIAVLSAIAIPRFTRSIEHQRCRNTIQTMVGLHGLLIMRESQTDNFPATGSDLNTLNTSLQSQMRLDNGCVLRSFTNHGDSYTTVFRCRRCLLTLDHQNRTTSGYPTCAAGPEGNEC